VQQHGSVSLTIETHIASTIAELVSAQRFDLGLAAYSMAPPATDAESFCEADEVCVLPRTHPLAMQPLVTPHMLAGAKFVFLGGNDPYRYRLDNIFEKAGIERDLIIETRNTSTACSLVLAGAGISIVNRLTAVEYLGAGLIMRRFSVGLPFNTTLLRPKFRPSSPIVDLFVQELRATRDHCLAMAEHALA
jgi:DNA-binding transcriptional LysR family regulator